MGNMRRPTRAKIEEWINKEFPEAIPAPLPPGAPAEACWSILISARAPVYVLVCRMVYGSVSSTKVFLVVERSKVEVTANFADTLPPREEFLSWIVSVIENQPKILAETIKDYENACERLRRNLTIFETAKAHLESK